MLKVLIVLLFVGLLLSLFSSLWYLLTDRGTTKRTAHLLGVRLTIAVALMMLLMYGLYTGQLGSKAPWDQRLQEAAPKGNASQNIDKKE